MKIISVVGARPNFMKVVPLHFEFKKFSNLDVNHLICHTGQHYDEQMSKMFLDEFDLPQPNFYLGVGSGSHAEQTAKIMMRFEKVLLKEKPDLVIVVGDVNSTIACSLTSVKLGIKVAHVEAGLRSFDRTMPEEINRILTDVISDILFVTERSGIINLLNEGIDRNKIFFVGNVMIDTLVRFMPMIQTSKIHSIYNLDKNDYCVVTLHRPSNVDNAKNLSRLVNLINKVSKIKKVIFPIHPRTKKNLEKFNLLDSLNNQIIVSKPLGYKDFISLIKESALVLTDSGGIQEETTYLGIPCITLRNTTERPITIEVGTNYLVGDNLDLAYELAVKVLNGNKKKGSIPELWDGKASERIVNLLLEKFNK